MKTNKNQKRRHRGVRGSISVFLVIILVPCICITSIFVDVSRVQMSKGIATSAADLTLNSLMSYYDYDLNDIYGLMASCQDIENYYAVADDYFLRMLSSQDMTEDEVLYIADQYEYKVLSDAKIADLMRLENKTEGGMTSGISGANMANPTILKDQIVEFMKYRAPIVVMEEIIARLNNISGEVTQFLDAANEENEKLMDEKEETFEAEGNFNKAAFYTYWAIRDYYDAANGMGLTKENDLLTEYATKLEGYRKAYEDIHKIMVKDLYNTQSNVDYNRPTAALDKYSYDKDDYAMGSYVTKFQPTAPPSPVYTAPPKVDPPIPTTPPATSANPHPTAPPTFTPAPDPTVPPAPVYTKPPKQYSVKADGFNKLMGEINTACNEFQTQINGVVNSCSDFINVPVGMLGTEAYGIQWWTQAITCLKNAKYTDAEGNQKKVDVAKKGDNLMKVYAKLICLMGIATNPSTPIEGRSSQESTAKTRIANLHAQYLTAGQTSETDAYIKLMSALEDSYNLYSINIDASVRVVTVDDMTMKLDDALTYINEQTTLIKTNADTLINYLNIAINGDGKSGKNHKVYPLDKSGDITKPETLGLKQLAQVYKQEYNQWKTQAGKEYTDLHTEDLTQIAEIEADGSNAGLSGDIDNKVNVLKNRLVNIKGEWEKISNAVTNMTYGGKTIYKKNNTSKGIKDYAGFRKAAKNAANPVKEADIPYKNDELNAYVESTFTNLWNPDDEKLVILKHPDDMNYHVLLDIWNNVENLPEFLTYLHDKYKNKPRNTIEEKQKEMDDGNSVLEDQETKNKEANNKRFHGPAGRDITSSYSEGKDPFNYMKCGIESLIDTVDALFNKKFDTIRDDLYVTTYIMNMLSYATFETEGMYQLLSEEEQKKLKLDPDRYYPDEYDTVKGDENTENSWLSTKLSDSYNKTLRNKMINELNNFAYLAEVEYILYGGTNKSNVKKVYGDIYEIRLALNLVSGMMNFFVPKEATGRLFDGIATAISGATAGIIPAPLIKILLITVFTAFETGKDMDRLDAGFPVELYKLKPENWWYALDTELNGKESIKDATNLLTSLGNKENTGTGLFYSDYLTFFVYLGLSSNKYAEGMYARLAEVMESNMQMMTAKTDFSLAKSQVYFKLDAKLRVAPLMLTLPYFDEFSVDLEKTDDWNTYDVSSVRGYP